MQGFLFYTVLENGQLRKCVEQWCLIEYKISIRKSVQKRFIDLIWTLF